MSTVVVATGALCREVTSVEHEVSGERVGVTVGSFGHRRVVLSGDRLVLGSGWLRLQGIRILWFRYYVSTGASHRAASLTAMPFRFA